MTDKPETFIPTLTKEERALMRHALGRESGHRNYYALYRNSSDLMTWRSLCGRGLASEFTSAVNEDMVFFYVTELGKQALAVKTRVVMPQDEEIQSLRDLVLDMLCQGAVVEGNEIDNMCMSTYERACDYLHEHGILEKVNDRIYFLRERSSE